MRYQVYSGGRLVGDNTWPGGFHGGDVRLLLLLSEEELKYDIANVAYIQGEVARVNDNYGHDLLGDEAEHYLHMWKDVCEDGNYERVLRDIDIAISDVEHALYRYVAQHLHRDLSLDNVKPDKRKEYTVELFVPYTFSESTCWNLLHRIHDYIVASVLKDWASITLPEVEARWQARKEESMDAILRATSMCGTHHAVKPSII